MARILLVQGSARKARSITRSMAAAFLDAWSGEHRGSEVKTRDLLDAPPPFVTEEWIAASFAADRNALTVEQRRVLAPSDELIGEVEWADIIVIATPMYNYGMPAALKAWFDMVIRVNKTFSFDLARGEQPIEPMLHGKTLVILSSRGEGDFGPGGVNEARNHLETHIAACKHFLGVDGDPRLVHVDYQEFGDQRQPGLEGKSLCGDRGARSRAGG